MMFDEQKNLSLTFMKSGASHGHCATAEYSPPIESEAPDVAIPHS